MGYPDLGVGPTDDALGARSTQTRLLKYLRDMRDFVLQE